MKRLIIIGAGGHGRVVADIAQKLNKYDSISFLDDENLQYSMGLSVVGKVEDVEKYISTCDIFVAIGNSKIRQKFIEKLIDLGANVPTLIHPSAIIGGQVEIDIGTAVMANAVINPCVKIGRGAIVNTCSSIDHDCMIGDYCHVCVGSHVAGTVNIGEHTWIGIGATIINNVKICENCMIGAGAVVIKDIVKSGTYIGVPAMIKE